MAARFALSCVALCRGSSHSSSSSTSRRTRSPRRRTRCGGREDGGPGRPSQGGSGPGSSISSPTFHAQQRVVGCALPREDGQSANGYTADTIASLRKFPNAAHGPGSSIASPRSFSTAGCRVRAPPRVTTGSLVAATHCAFTREWAMLRTSPSVALSATIRQISHH